MASNRMHAILDPVVGRYIKLEDEEREELRSTLVAYRNLFSFLAQAIPFQDSDLEKLYSFLRYLLTKLPKGDRGPIYHFNDDVALKYYRLQKISEGSIVLEPGKVIEIPGPTEVGTRKAKPEEIGLSQLVDIRNDRFGTTFKPADQLFDSIKEDAVANGNPRQAALANTEENFGYVFRKALEGLIVARLDQNEEIAGRCLNEADIQEIVAGYLQKAVYEIVREQTWEH